MIAPEVRARPKHPGIMCLLRDIHGLLHSINPTTGGTGHDPRLAGVHSAMLSSALRCGASVWLQRLRFAVVSTALNEHHFSSVMRSV